MKTIPFNYDLWKAGKGKAIYLNGAEPWLIGEAPPKVAKLEIFSIDNKSNIHWHYKGGDTNFEPEFSLLLQIEPTYVPLEQKDWIFGGPWWIRRKTGEVHWLVVKTEIDSIWTQGSKWRLETVTTECERTNAERMSDPSIPEDQKWVACRKEAA